MIPTRTTPAVPGPPQFVLPTHLYRDGGTDYDDVETGFRVISDPGAALGLLRAGAGDTGPARAAAVWTPVLRCIGPEAVIALRPTISRIAHGLVDGIVGRADQEVEPGRFDVVTDFSLPLVAHVINQVVGFDPADYAEAAADLGGCANLLTTGFPGPGEHLWPNGDGLLELLDERRVDLAVGSSTALGLMTELLAAQQPDATAGLDGPAPGAAIAQDGGGITAADILGVFSELGSLAGAAAAAALTTTLALVEHAGRIEELHLHAERAVPPAVAEALRLQPPRPLVRIDPPGGTPPGQAVAVSVAAAHRNPAWYRDPDEYHPERGLQGNDLQLGLGVYHFLLVAQVEVGLTALATRMPGLRAHPTGARQWPASIPAAFSLPCTFDAAAARELAPTRH